MGETEKAARAGDSAVLGSIRRPGGVPVRGLVVTATFMGADGTSATALDRLTGPLPVYPCGFLWCSISRTQMRDP